MGSGSILLLVKSSVNALIKLEFSDAGSGGLGWGGPSQHKDIRAGCPYVGCDTGVTKGGAMLVVVIKGVNRDATVAAWLLLGFCCAINCKMG